MRPRTTIGVQLLILLIGCLLVMHLIIFAVIVLTPPPRPPIYRFSEIATALSGGALDAADGPAMRRTTVAELPREFAQARHQATHGVEALALAVDRPGAELRLVRHRPSPLDRMGRPPTATRIILKHRHAGDGPPGLAGHGPIGPNTEPPPELRHILQRETPLFGEFSAALRRADGRWTVVRSGPEAFPTDWQKRILLLLLGGLAVVAPAAFLFARRITAPLKRFADAAERLGRDPHALPVALSGPAEIGVAAEAFNNMQARVRRYIDDRTAMVGAMSHDLRTPLARIRFKLEGAPDALKTSVLGDVAQMEQMLQGVLAFIRDESTPRRRERLDLLSLVECVVDDAAMVGGDVELVASGPAAVEGDPVALQRLFVNLVDNALKYGGQARISVRCQDQVVQVDIVDAGPGLSTEELARVFEPFYRADRSRNLDTGGIGLGLPIARATARAHGGDVSLTSSAAGLCATVTLPAG